MVFSLVTSKFWKSAPGVHHSDYRMISVRFHIFTKCCRRIVGGELEEIDMSSTKLFEELSMEGTEDSARC